MPAHSPTPQPTPEPTATPTPTQIPGRPELYEDIAVPDHLAYTWWEWNRDSQFREVTLDFTIHSDPGHFSDDYGLYLMVCFGSISNHDFYFGLQTDVNDPNQGRGRGKGLIFSRWGERDLAFTRVAGDDDGWYESSGHEGDFIGVRRGYDWGTGDYRMRLAPDGLDDDGEWYSVWITDLSTDESVWAGSLKFPLVGGTTAVKPPLYSTLEIYGRPSIRPIDIPEWYVSMRLPGGDGIVASSGDPGYSGFGKSPKANADVQYDRETGVLHFRIGGVTKMVGDGEPLRFQPTHTPIPANTPTPSPTDTPAPTNTPVPTNTPTPMPTNTPVPVVKLVLDAESTVVGYWSDGTADVEVTATLRNDGKLRLDRAQDITAKCMAQNDESRDCSEELSLSLPNGLAPASGSFTLRLPMGVTTLNFDYGESEPLALDIDVPERILGVDRKVLECYADRPAWRRRDRGGERSFEGCGGWRSPTVEKWLSDVPVKVWGTGDPEYIAVLEAVLAELDLQYSAWSSSGLIRRVRRIFKAFVGVYPFSVVYASLGSRLQGPHVGARGLGFRKLRT